MPKDKEGTFQHPPVVVTALTRRYNDGKFEGGFGARTRRGSFFQDFTARAGDREVGFLRMHFHENESYTNPLDGVLTGQGEFSEEAEALFTQNPNDLGIGKRRQGEPTAYIESVHNYTLEDEATEVKGVGTALMRAAQDSAAGDGAVKMSLEPSRSTITRKLKSGEEVKQEVDPTGWYLRKAPELGYEPDPDLQHFDRLQLEWQTQQYGLTKEEVLAKEKANDKQRTRLLSKRLKKPGHG